MRKIKGFNSFNESDKEILSKRKFSAETFKYLTF